MTPSTYCSAIDLIKWLVQPLQQDTRHAASFLYQHASYICPTSLVAQAVLPVTVSYICCLQVLEFRAYRLSTAGLTCLTGQLPRLVSMSCHGLDTCLDAATASCFAACPSLRELHLVRSAPECNGMSCCRREAPQQ